MGFFTNLVKTLMRAGAEGVAASNVGAHEGYQISNSDSRNLAMNFPSTDLTHRFPFKPLDGSNDLIVIGLPLQGVVEYSGNIIAKMESQMRSSNTLIESSVQNGIEIVNISDIENPRHPSFH